MGIFGIEIFFWILPLKEEKELCNACLRFQRCHINFSGVIDTAEIISVVSLTPLKLFQWCQWHRWNRFSVVNDTAEIVSAVSMTPLKSIQWCQWHRLNSAKKFCSLCPYEIFHFAISVISAVSMTLRKSFQRCQWHRWNFNIIDFLSKCEAICETAIGRKSGP
jgi:hypothetical protein